MLSRQIEPHPKVLPVILLLLFLVEDILQAHLEVLIPQEEQCQGQLLLVHLTIDLLVLIQVHDSPLQEEVQAQHSLALVQLDLVLQVLALLVGVAQELEQAHQEAQVGPQEALAQEDPEEGGINSPFFLG